MGVLENLAVEILINIFKYVTITDLCRLRLTCKRFNDIITTWTNYIIPSNQFEPTFTNQSNKLFSSRCSRKIPSIFEKLRIEHMWKTAKLNEKILLYDNQLNYITQLHLTNENLWISRGINIYKYKRSQENGVNPIATDIIPIPQDRILWRPRRHPSGLASLQLRATKFAIKNDILISGFSFGGFMMKNLKSNQCFMQETETASYIHSIDITSDNRLVASGSRSNLVDIFALQNNNDTLGLIPLTTKKFFTPPWSIKFNDHAPFLLCGFSEQGYGIMAFDTNCFRNVQSFRNVERNRDSLILDLKWDDTNTSLFWSCGTGRGIERWDLRTGICSASLSDNYGIGALCIDYDSCNTLVSGSQFPARVTLWDIRYTDGSYRTHLMNTKTNNSSVNCVCFDSEYLYAGLRTEVHYIDINKSTKMGENQTFKLLRRFMQASHLRKRAD